MIRTFRLYAAVAAVAASLPVARATAQVTGPHATPARGTPTAIAPRAVRRDIPLTDMIRRAFAAGTRDSLGTPGPRYWQLWMDYKIDARFDSATSTVTGSETAVIHNNSDSAMHSIVLRLDQNLFAPNVPRAEQVTEITDGMQVTRLTASHGMSPSIAGRRPPRSSHQPGYRRTNPPAPPRLHAHTRLPGTENAR